jgi:hypothetical protein
LAQRLLEGDFQEGDRVTVDLAGGEMVLQREETAPVPESREA